MLSLNVKFYLLKYPHVLTLLFNHTFVIICGFKVSSNHLFFFFVSKILQANVIPPRNLQQ